MHEAGGENKHHSISSSEEGGWALLKLVTLPCDGGIETRSCLHRKTHAEEKCDFYPREAESGFEEIS